MKQLKKYKEICRKEDEMNKNKENSKENERKGNFR